mmetsp:Transcript_15058/g.32415  ORF Transcript_15058/g.32415 Transcript_15058/m.32415 type:complete len:336 (+) Transcript_15058:113-1120(+)|eukprot:CAMPEP_0206458918 /NCGR_PEP_ID=MMETSP0324_2-20121206/23862_1 /ASSEMBLY_ACC=CAM_ASM_000836 /TAXON_ID=2866 /ORGANISM="Crypthecodinium cohnii, Strain Seligo" /LENGTH=335 /DNA_ID=CAMNT_0053930361 /DNA_START=106 /DNA_END=1113 /DNA_ORIENTATION=-
MSKKCDGCGEPYRGFGTTCANCRRRPSVTTPKSADMTGDVPPDHCQVCRKRVYAMEAHNAEGHLFHKDCFQCVTCGRKLAGTNFAKNEMGFFCLPHFRQISQVTGGYSAGQGPMRNAQAASLLDSMVRRGEGGSVNPAQASESKCLQATLAPAAAPPATVVKEAAPPATPAPSAPAPAAPPAASTATDPPSPPKSSMPEATATMAAPSPATTMAAAEEPEPVAARTLAAAEGNGAGQQAAPATLQADVGKSGEEAAPATLQAAENNGGAEAAPTTLQAESEDKEGAAGGPPVSLAAAEPQEGGKLAAQTMSEEDGSAMEELATLDAAPRTMQADD